VNRNALIPILEKIFRTRDAKFWLARCRKSSIPAALVQGVREALQSDAGQLLVARAGEYETLRHPVRVDGRRMDAGKPAPKLGQHTTPILRELGYDAKSINAMERDGIIARRSPKAATARRRR